MSCDCDEDDDCTCHDFRLLEGTKHDEGKLRYDLEPHDAREEVIKVYTFGAGKYGDRNWELGLTYHRAYRAARQHMAKWWSGEQIDHETKFHPLAHAICELEFLLAFELRKMKQFDDRPTYNKEVIPNEGTI